MIKLDADSIQSVAFLEPNAPQDDALKLWDRLFPGDSPDGFQRPANSPNLETTASGERSNYAVLIKSQVGRIDVVLTASLAGVVAPSPAKPPRIADVEAATRLAANYLKKIVQNLRVIRTAIVLDLGQTISRGMEGAALSELLHPITIPTASKDAIVQFNVRRFLQTAPDVELNRLVTWSAGQIGFLQNPAGVIVGGPMIMTPYVGLKIDINTVAQTRIAESSLEPIIEEVADECLAIYKEGASRFLT